MELSSGGIGPGIMKARVKRSIPGNGERDQLLPVTLVVVLIQAVKEKILYFHAIFRGLVSIEEGTGFNVAVAHSSFNRLSMC